MALDPQREQGLARLALIGLARRQEQVLGELLGDGRAALADAAFFQIGHRRAQHAARIDAAMLVETAILCGQNGVDQVLGQLLRLHMLSVAGAAGGDFLAVAVEHDDRRLAVDVPEVRAFRHARRHMDEGEAEDEGGAEKEQRHGRARERAPQIAPGDAVAGGFRIFRVLRVGLFAFRRLRRETEQLQEIIVKGGRAALQIVPQIEDDGGKAAAVVCALFALRHLFFSFRDVPPRRHCHGIAPGVKSAASSPLKAAETRRKARDLRARVTKRQGGPERRGVAG